MNQAPKRDPGEPTAFGLVAATFLLIVFFIFTRYYRYLTFALITSIALYLKTEDRVRKPALAFVALAAALVLSGIVAFRSRSVLWCFAASACWALGLYAARYLGRRNRFITELLKGGFQFALTFSVVTGALSAVAAGLWRFPPDDILDWGDRIERMHRLFESLERYTLPAALLIAALFVVLVWKGARSDSLTGVWKKLAAARAVVNRAALAAAIVLSFSFTVIHADGPNPYDGPLTALDHSRAEALQRYANLVQRIELNLRGTVKLQAYTDVFQSRSPSTQQATIQEAAVSEARRQIPPEYLTSLPANPASLDTSQVVSWVNTCTTSGRFWSAAHRIVSAHPCADSQAEWKSALASSAYTTDRSAGSGTSPPPGVTLRALAAADSAARNLDADTKPPEGMAGLGALITSQLLDLSVSLDSIPGLKSFIEQFPLVSELLDVAFDAIKALTTTEVEARQIAWDCLRDSSVPLRDRIRNAARAHRAKVDPDADRIAASEQRSRERAAAVAQGEVRFRPDLSRAVSDLAAQSDVQREKVERVRRADQASGKDLEKVGDMGKPANLVTPQGLVYIETRQALYDQALSALAVDPAHATALKRILSESEFEEYRKRGQLDRSIRAVPGVRPGEVKPIPGRVPEIAE